MSWQGGAGASGGGSAQQEPKGGHGLWPQRSKSAEGSVHTFHTNCEVKIC